MAAKSKKPEATGTTKKKRVSKAIVAQPPVQPMKPLDPLVPLDAEGKELLREALDLAAETADEIGDRVVRLGRWLLSRVFKGDAETALSENRHYENPVWRELLRRSGGPTCRLSDHALSVSLRMAAHDKRINDDTFRLLDPGRKELLLPLPSDDALREAAQHVVAFKLTQNQTKEYVAALRKKKGSEKELRLTPGRLASRLDRACDEVASPEVLKHAKQRMKSATPAEKALLAKSVRAMKKALQKYEKILGLDEEA